MSRNPIGAHFNKTFKQAMPFTTLYKPHSGAKKFYDEHGIQSKTWPSCFARRNRPDTS